MFDVDFGFPFEFCRHGLFFGFVKVIFNDHFLQLFLNARPGD
jgi:hypothetical protein